MRYYLKPTGAPKGGRVHWFLWCLDIRIRKRYVVSYDYATHNYALYRKNKQKLSSVVLVVRTCDRTFRLMYHNELTGQTLYRSFISAKKTAQWLNDFLLHEELNEKEAIERELLLENFSKRLSKLLLKHHITQSEFASKLGYRQQTVSKWLHKEYLPTNDVIEKTANFFGVDFDYFKGEE